MKCIHAVISNRNGKGKKKLPTSSMPTESLVEGMISSLKSHCNSSPSPAVTEIDHWKPSPSWNVSCNGSSGEVVML